MTGPATGEVERSMMYERYRLEPLNDSTVLRDQERLSVGQLENITEDCPEAQKWVVGEYYGPLLLMIAGGGLLAFGTPGVLSDRYDPTDSDVDVILAATGAGIFGVGALLEMLLNPPVTDVRALSRAYNACLRDQLDLGQAAARPPPADFPPARLPIDPALQAQQTETSTAPTMLRLGR